ncbi:hypothetical protein [Lentzea sp. NPDC092896]|uniref:hypothetical protein n=1 Tax=Lentzea sp. NPDC092896 TaxID=3364127 RepID=UPI00382D2A3F
MRRRAFGVLFSGLVLGATIVAPHASAEPCRWVARDLPVPEGSEFARTSGSSDSNRFIVGEAKVGEDFGESGLLWDDGALTRLASAGSDLIAVRPRDVNDSGLVVGRQNLLLEQRSLAFLYRDGAYEILETPAGHSSQAKAVNNVGDVAGEVWKSDTPNDRQVVVWPHNGPAKGFLSGPAVGISDDGKLVQVAGTSVFVTDVVSGRQAELPDMSPPVVFDNDRVLYPTSSGLGEWNLAGEQVMTWEGGTWPSGRSASGHLVFGYASGVASLWQEGIRFAFDSEKQPVFAQAYHGDVTDEGVLIGTYEGFRGSSHPARWFRCG